MPARIKILKGSHVDPALHQVIQKMKKLGFEKDGRLEVRLSLAASQLSLSPTKLRFILNLLDQNGYVQYTKPFTGKSTKVIGDLSLVDFTKLNRRYQHKLQKLRAMENYADTPDDKKQDFLQDYFVSES